jgi:hypothetical protein
MFPFVGVCVCINAIVHECVICQTCHLRTPISRCALSCMCASSSTKKIIRHSSEVESKLRSRLEVCLCLRLRTGRSYIPADVCICVDADWCGNHAVASDIAGHEAALRDGAVSQITLFVHNSTLALQSVLVTGSACVDSHSSVLQCTNTVAAPG